MRLRDLDQQRHGLFRPPLADRSHCLHLNFRIASGALRGCAQEFEAAFARALAEQANRLASYVNRIVAFRHLEQLVFNARALDV